MWFWLSILSAFLYAVTNVLNSTLVAKYFQSPTFLMWMMTFFTVFFLLAAALTNNVTTSWTAILLVCGCIAYIGDWYFFWVLHRLDISVVNAAWAIQAIYTSIIGLFFFSETWTAPQFFGAGLVIAGVLLLSFFHAHVSVRRTLLLLTTLPIVYLPLVVARKASLSADQPLLSVVFWLLFGRDATALLVPVLFRKQRLMILQTLPRCRFDFFILCAFVAVVFLVAEFLLVVAYAQGPVSLISIVSNVQPFFVILFSGLLAYLFPRMAPKELFTRRSTSIKVVSFAIVFAGLALVAASQ